jgi:hypothetical protein
MRKLMNGLQQRQTDYVLSCAYSVALSDDQVDKFYHIRSLGEAAIEPLTTGGGVVLVWEECSPALGKKQGAILST